MVVDDIEDDAQARLVRGIHERAKIVRSPVQMRRREQVDAVVAPSEASGELADRHDLDRRDTDVGEVAQPVDRRGEGSFAREGADVQFVKNLVRQMNALPAIVVPNEGRRVDHYRSAVWSLRLKTRCRIGKGIPLVETEAVFRSG